MHRCAVGELARDRMAHREPSGGAAIASGRAASMVVCLSSAEASTSSAWLPPTLSFAATDHLLRQARSLEVTPDIVGVLRLALRAAVVTERGSRWRPNGLGRLPDQPETDRSMGSPAVQAWSVHVWPSVFPWPRCIVPHHAERVVRVGEVVRGGRNSGRATMERSDLLVGERPQQRVATPHFVVICQLINYTSTRKPPRVGGFGLSRRTPLLAGSVSCAAFGIGSRTWKHLLARGLRRRRKPTARPRHELCNIAVAPRISKIWRAPDPAPYCVSER